ncbi:hypothetical protein T492DRAFT_851427, partial [Pavlovales sp. CCMP2436]
RALQPLVLERLLPALAGFLGEGAAETRQAAKSAVSCLALAAKGEGAEAERNFQRALGRGLPEADSSSLRKHGHTPDCTPPLLFNTGFSCTTWACRRPTRREFGPLSTRRSPANPEEAPTLEIQRARREGGFFDEGTFSLRRATPVR